jgi:hypothetical protein
MSIMDPGPDSSSTAKTEPVVPPKASERSEVYELVSHQIACVVQLWESPRHLCYAKVVWVLGLFRTLKGRIPSEAAREIAAHYADLPHKIRHLPCQAFELAHEIQIILEDLANRPPDD